MQGEPRPPANLELKSTEAVLFSQAKHFRQQYRLLEQCISKAGEDVPSFDCGGPGLCTNGTRDFRKHFCFSVKLIWATIEHLFMVLGQIKTCTFF